MESNRREGSRERPALAALGCGTSTEPYTRCMGKPAARRRRGLPLAVSVTAPFALVGILSALLLSVAGSGALSRATKEEARLFADIFGKRLVDYLGSFFHDPVQASVTTAERIANGSVDLRRIDVIESELVPKIRHYPWLTFVGVGLPDGSYVSVSRSPENGALLFFISDPATSFRLYHREIAANDRPGGLLAIGQRFDTREASWYEEASRRSEAFWTPPSTLYPYSIGGMVYTVPVRGPSGELIAVVRGGVALLQVSRYLREALPDASTLALVADDEGRLLASSSRADTRSSNLPLSGLDRSDDPLIRAAGSAMRTSEASLITHLADRGKTWSLERFPFHGDGGLRMDVGIMLDDSHFAGPLLQFRRSALGLIAVATIAIGIIGYLLGRAISRPVTALGARAARLAAGDRGGKPVPDSFAAREVAELSDSFESMSRALVGIMDGLEAKVAERTDQLETLLREVNHRIKNTLNVAASLLALQASMSRSEETQTALDEAAARIKSMALLYTRLHFSSDLEEVDLGAYIDTVLDYLAEGSVGPRPIEVARSLESLAVSARRASHIGIVINELFTNACKYAFPEGRSGKVEVVAKAEGEGILVEVADDGIGLPAGFDLERNAGFGLSVASSLARDLGGSLTAKSDAEGAVFSLRLPFGLEGGGE